MTDAIDIKALRCQAETAIVCGGMFAISGEQALSLLDQLEAERQRAESLSKSEWKMACELSEAQAELAALKSDQVPVGDADYTRYSCGCCGFDSLHHTTKCPECNYHKIESEPLFTAPQKPAEYFRVERTAQIAAVKRLDTTPLNKVFTANAILRVMYDINRCVEKREDK